jgi:hypothetical protein
MGDWLCDERVGMVAVYRGPKFNCLARGATEHCVYVAHGYRYRSSWKLPRRYVWRARLIAWLLNRLAQHEEKNGV